MSDQKEQLTAADTGQGLTGILESLAELAKERDICFGDIVDRMRHRGFGPLFLAPALIVVMPTGALPGIPAVCGILILSVSLQLLTGKKRPWLPTRVTQVKFDKEKLAAGIKKVTPYTLKIDSYVQHRFAFLARNGWSKRFVALTSLILAVLMIAFGFIPFAPMALGIPILLFALGLSVKDGALIAIGYAMIAGIAAFYFF